MAPSAAATPGIWRAESEMLTGAPRGEVKGERGALAAKRPAARNGESLLVRARGVLGASLGQDYPTR